MSQQSSSVRVATLLGVVAVLAFSIANLRRVDAVSQQLDARLARVELGGGTSLASVPSSAIDPQRGTTVPPTLDPEPPAVTPAATNATIDVFAGVAPSGTAIPDASRVYQFDLQGSPSKGPEDAPVTIVEFSDFQCSFCRRAQPTLEKLDAVYGDRIRWVWKHLPLAMHEHAPRAHLASVAAARQGRFWDFHKKLFTNQGQLDPESVRLYAYDLGLDVDRFEKDQASAAAREIVERDMKEAVEIDLTATPGFFINGRYVRGAKPFEAFAEMINGELERLGLPVPPEATIVE